jgi:hypothetical protein
MSSTVLFAWELGGGLGHIMRLAPLANHLARQGHKIFAALRELRGAPGAFDPTVQLLPAPFRSGAPPPLRATTSFADVLDDITFADEGMLRSHVAAWRSLYDLIRPNLIVFDHSPTALLAARGLAVRRVITGNGFSVPPDQYPMPTLRPWEATNLDRLREREDQVLLRANRVLNATAQPALERLGQLYSDADETLITTFPELDPYAEFRPADIRYFGPILPSGGEAPHWPPLAGKKVFAYLHWVPALEKVIRFLKRSGIPTLARIDGLPPQMREELSSPALRFESQRLDVSQVGRDCDLAILNGNGGTTAAMLLAGRPMLQIPAFLEHTLNARAVEQLGAGLCAPMREADTIIARLQAMLGTSRYTLAAQDFARRHESFDAAREGQEMRRRIEALVAD